MKEIDEALEQVREWVEQNRAKKIKDSSLETCMPTKRIIQDAEKFGYVTFKIFLKAGMPSN